MSITATDHAPLTAAIRERATARADRHDRAAYLCGLAALRATLEGDEHARERLFEIQRKHFDRRDVLRQIARSFD